MENNQPASAAANDFKCRWPPRLTRNRPKVFLAESDEVPWGDKEIYHDEEEDRKAKENKPKFTLQDYNLIFAMPFFCSIGIKLPFIYLVIELKESFGLNLGIIGILVGAFHFCRVLAIVGSILSTRISHFIGTLLGLSGYVALLLYSDTSNVAVFACCNIVSGFAEASAAVFVYSKEVYSTE